MIILDTNVLSEEMKPVPTLEVHRWLLRQNAVELFTTSVCEAEILAGIAVLPAGRRKSDLEVAARRIFALFPGRILAFDSAAAAEYANIISVRQRSGRPIDGFDAQIASIARLRGFAIATRDGSGFEGTGAKVINPWVV